VGFLLGDAIGRRIHRPNGESREDGASDCRRGRGAASGDARVAAGAEAPLRFVVRTPAREPATLESYMGMAAHAMIVRDDGSVFVHLHPAGTIALASQQAFLLRQRGDTVRGALGRRLT